MNEEVEGMSKLRGLGATVLIGLLALPGGARAGEKINVRIEPKKADKTAEKPDAGKKPPVKKTPANKPADWVEHFEKRLSRKVNVDFKDAPLTEVISFIQQIADAGMELDPDAKVEAEKKITLKAEGLELREVLDRVLGPAGLERRYRNRKLFITTAKKQQVVIAGGAAAKKKSPAGETVEFVETPARKVINYVASKGKLNIIIDPKCGKLLDTPVTFRTKGMKLRQILDWALRLSRTERRLVDGVIYIRPKGPEKKLDLKELLEKAKEADRDGLLREPPKFKPPPEVKLPESK
jgi:hypothetical protein